MITSFIITFREVLEVALIVGIVLGYLIKTNRTKYNNVVYMGILFGVIASVIGALLFVNLAGGFSGQSEQIFEGITMFIGAFLLTTMILWMMKQKHISNELKEKIDEEIHHNHKYGLFMLVFISVLREGIELVIFLGAASFVSTNNTLQGALWGIITALFLGFMIFVGSMKINLKVFFNLTSILLILFAAGLIAHGIHEFQEAKIIPTVIEHMWDINPEPVIDGIYPVLHEKGSVGSIFKSLFGYNGNPSLIELLGYITYLIIVLILWKNINLVHKVI